MNGGALTPLSVDELSLEARLTAIQNFKDASDEDYGPGDNLVIVEMLRYNGYQFSPEGHAYDPLAAAASAQAAFAEGLRASYASMARTAAAGFF